MPNTTPTPLPDKTRLRIRMYRQGIGDCFLLTFRGKEQNRHILIDCGVLSGTPGGKAVIQKIAKNIVDETGGEKGKLDALVVTHEHWDHVSGFHDAKDIFGPMDIGEIWLAWTEDPINPLASNMKTKNRLKLKAVHMALTQLAKAEDPQAQFYGQGIAGLMGFFGGPADGATLAAFSEKTKEAMDAVTQRKPSPTYKKPGELIEPKWLPEVRVYVLGPPLDQALLKKMEGRVGTEIYELAGADGTFTLALEGMLAAAGDKAADPNRAEWVEAALPFHPSLQWRDEEQLCNHRKFGQLFKNYKAKELSWRCIDHDWLLSAARLGLQLDSATNNTSLVLAFELCDNGEVLLFAADAQIGSWKSWLPLKWKLGKDADAKTIKTPDLLGRTVFYKVGHHGSHNATLKEGGLEAMTSPALVAALPLNQDFANNSKHWDMPAPALYARLQQQTRGRILRADAAWPTPDDPKPEIPKRTDDQPPRKLKEEDWQRFKKAVVLDPDNLFIDYFL
jgi:Metallo-beta-lactamase superfamily